MKKVVIIGNCGSGKSVFARKLHEKTGLPLTYLDMLYWNKDKSFVTPDVFDARLKAELEKSEWILDGNFSRTMKWRISECDTVIFMDYPVEICLQGVRNRLGTVRPDMPWVESGEDKDFMTFIQKFPKKEKTKILAMLETFKDKTIYIFHSREESEEFLSSL